MDLLLSWFGMYKLMKLCLLFLFILLATPSLAWNWNTHSYWLRRSAGTITA